jgi:N-acetylglucosaminyldiphosphoundecaprenol N-acetyl-beta-D-mannosaminyltransferase
VNASTPVARHELFGCHVDALTMDQAVARCDECIATGAFCQHMALNTAKLVAVQQNDSLRNAVNESGLVTADGQGVVWASRLLGHPLPERVTGIDLMERLLELSAGCGYRVFILGARREVLDRAIEVLAVRYPTLVIAGSRDGYFAETETAAVCEQIRRSQAQLLFVAMSSPRKELFLRDHGAMLGVPFVMGVGGAIDVLAGRTRRAPQRWQRAGLEWLYRLLQEPRRMAPRYASSNARFAFMLLRALTHEHSWPRR